MNPANSSPPRILIAGDQEDVVEEVQRILIRKSLGRYDGNARQAAEALGLSRTAFYRRLEKHEL